MNYIIKFLLAGILLGCLAKMPYGYFQFVKIAGCALFIWLAYLEYSVKRVLTTILCVGAALLFNPIIKIHFTRVIWNKIDFAIAIALIIWILIDLILYWANKNEILK